CSSCPSREYLPSAVIKAVPKETGECGSCGSATLSIDIDSSRVPPGIPSHMKSVCSNLACATHRNSEFGEVLEMENATRGSRPAIGARYTAPGKVAVTSSYSSSSYTALPY